MTSRNQLHIFTGLMWLALLVPTLGLSDEWSCQDFFEYWPELPSARIAGSQISISRQGSRVDFTPTQEPQRRIAEIVRIGPQTWAVRTPKTRSREFEDAGGRMGRFVRAVHQDGLAYVLASSADSHLVQGTYALLEIDIQSGRISTLSEGPVGPNAVVDVAIDRRYLYVIKGDHIVAYSRTGGSFGLPEEPIVIPRR